VIRSIGGRLLKSTTRRDRPLPRFHHAMSDSFTVIAELNGVTHTFSCRADQTVLAAAEEAGVPLPSSCCSGVCTTCAARLRQGEVHQPDAMGVKADLQAEGFALLCVSYPLSDLNLVAGQEDALYEVQFGQYQR
jgi:ferredoxin